ncbi:hypothetical protein HDV00_012053 [Rhizophlyctis rosea]|nr:hypothetical protein HDV00_012053 [Rhizophlyctis rosea]
MASPSSSSNDGSNSGKGWGQTVFDALSRNYLLEILGMAGSKPSGSPTPPPNTAQKPVEPPKPTAETTATGDIPHVTPEVWKNPYYPLSGPPKTPEEQTQLKRQIESEGEVIRQAIQKRQVAKLDLQAAAEHNCVDLELAWQLCKWNKGWSFWKTQCVEMKEEYQKCVEKQKKFMEDLGYDASAKKMSDERRKEISMLADDMFLMEKAAELRAKMAEQAQQEQPAQ